jgi:hypothetical protein
MKKIVFWKNEIEDILFKEQISMIDLPRMGETVIWMKRRLKS